MADAHIPDIGKYRIVEIIGEGAMGVVYRAVDSVLGRTVAIKVMNESIARQPDLRQRFLHEAQAAASLQHPNVVCIYDLGESEGHLFIAMEYVPGLNLESLIESGEPLSIQEKLDIAIDILTGLTFAHKSGIIHRDIKPANIQVAADGRAKIMDFGVAHLASSNLTNTGASLGTPGYMAPEQIIEGKTTPATDIFAVGVVLYELLTGVKPFEGTTMQNLFYKIISEDPPPVTQLVPGLPKELDRIVRKALAKEVRDRPATALDMANELSAVRGKLSGPSYPASVSLSATIEHAIAKSQQTTRARNRHSLMVGAGAVVGLVVVVLGWSMMGSKTVTTTTAPGVSAPAPVGAAPVTPAPATSGAATTPPASAAKIVVPTPTPTPTPTPPTRAQPQRTAAVERPSRGPVVPSATVERPTRSALAVAPPSSMPAVSALPSAAPTATQQSVQQGGQIEIVTPRPPAVAATRPTPESTPSAPAAPTAADLTPTIEAYARAIESRDIAAIRRVYPGLTSDQQRGFEQFFQFARGLNVTFRIANVEASGSSADARVSGSYEYETSTGKRERQSVSFAATLRKDGAAWRLVSVH